MMSALMRTCVLSALLSLAACRNAAGPEPADIAFVGPIYTMDQTQPWVDAVAVSGGQIVYAGLRSGLEPYLAESTERVELGNGMLLPGFIDSHMHPMRAGNRFLRCQLHGLTWPDQILDELERCEESLAPGQWLRGVGLEDELFDRGVLHKSILDGITSERPGLVTNESGVLAWANSAALALAGIDKTSPEPVNGAIDREAGSTEPTGVLRFSASVEVYRRIPEPGERDLREALQLASRMANAFGITSASEAATYPENLAAFVAADRAGELTLRISASQTWEFDRGLEQAAEMAARRDAYSSPFFQANSAKLFLDGGQFMQGGAALLEPYAGAGIDYGQLQPADPGQLVEIVFALDEAGMNLHLHTLGDRAVRSGLDALQAALEANPPRDRRHQLAHLALVDAADLPRFATLGVTANFQALWAYLGQERRIEVANIGPERAARMIAIRAMLDTGARVVFGSDWISKSMNPLYSIQVAVTRRPPDGDGPSWLPEQRVSLEESLRAYTIDGAWLAGREGLVGSIEAGKAADLVVLERNLFEVDPMEISRVEVLRTLLGGRTVYQRTSSHP